MSVYYCVGNIGVKRKDFRSPRENSICADNDDVLSYFSLSGKLYCLLSSLPFSDMLVRDYIAYQRALQRCKPFSDKEIKYLMKAVGCKLGLYRRIGTLSRVQFRHVQLAAKWSIDTKTLYVNLDGLHYCRKNAVQVRKMLDSLKENFEVYVALSDSRFVPKGSHIIEYSQDGSAKVLKARAQLSKLTPKKTLCKYFKDGKTGDIDIKSVKNVVLISR